MWGERRHIDAKGCGMTQVKITDQESFEAWLKTRPAADDDILAARIGLRVFPLWGRSLERPWAKQKKLTALPVLRILLIKFIAQGDKRKFHRGHARSIAYYGFDGRTYASSYLSAVYASDAAAAAKAVPFSLGMNGVFADANGLQNGQDPSRLPLWPDSPPVWWENSMRSIRLRWDKDPETWAFWRRWLDGMISGAPLPIDLMEAVASIELSLWDQGPEAVAEAIRGIERALQAKAISPLSRTYLFDFVEHEKKLRLSGVALDFEGRSEEEIAKCLSKVQEFKDDLLDWIDNSKDALHGTNEVSSLQKTAQKIVDLIDTQGGDKNFPAARLLTLGASLRLFSLDEIQRAKVGATLAQIMDQRIDQLSALIGQCFGHVLTRLEPLNDLELGSNDPTAMIAQLREFVERLKSVDPAEVLPMDVDAKAQVMELLRELDEMDAAISAGADPKQVAVLQSRFANRYGALGATLARSIEKGRAFSGKAASHFDESVKWYKRWETLSNILDWFNNLPPPT